MLSGQRVFGLDRESVEKSRSRGRQARYVVQGMAIAATVDLVKDGGVSLA